MPEIPRTEEVEYALADGQVNKVATITGGEPRVIGFSWGGQRYQVPASVAPLPAERRGFATPRDVPAPVVVVAYILLYAFQKWQYGPGASAVFELGGRRWLATLGTHPPSKVKPYDHPGIDISVEVPPAASEAPGAPGAPAPSYCELATYDAAILKALNPDFVRGSIPSFATRVECDEAEARRALEWVAGQPEVARTEAEARRRWEAARPAQGDAAATRKWSAAEPPPITSPSRWGAMSPADRTTWKSRVRAWMATGPEPVPPEAAWARVARYLRQHPTTSLAAGGGLLVVVAAAIAASRRGPRRLPVERTEGEEGEYGET